MIKQAVEYYHQLLSDPELAAASQRMLDDQFETSRLVFGGRRLSPYLRPHFVMESDWTMIKAKCEIIFCALQKVKDAAIADEAILDELGLTDVERELVRIDPKYAHVSPTSRLDSFLVGETYSFVELNGESPAGIAFADSAAEIFKKLPVMQKFVERYNIQTLEGSSKLLEVLISCFTEFCGGTMAPDPMIAIIDLKGMPTIKEFELFQNYFEQMGYRSIICSPDELVFDGSRLSCNGVEIDIVYKRLLVNEYLPIMADHPDLIDAYRAGAICMVNSFRGKLVHKKAIFAVLTNERYRHLFDDSERSAIALHVPWTRKFRREQTENKGESIDLVEWTRSNSQKLVLKPNDDYGGHGIFIGWNSTPAEWDAAISEALENGDYLVQERVKTAREFFPMLTDDEGNWELVEQLVDLDPLLFLGKVGSAFTRLSSNELANVTAGGGMVPTFILSEK
ncbi:MAG: hypothetical protein ABJA02_01060 [Acidobacteriota bacterium]